jgi:hypothetical protein
MTISTEGTAIAYSKIAWDLLTKEILSASLTDEERVQVIELLDSANTHLTNAYDDHLLVFDDLNAYTDDEEDIKLLFQQLNPRIPKDEWYSITITDAYERHAGNWDDNPFDMFVQHRIKMRDANCDVWVSSGIQFIPQPIQIPIAGSTASIDGYKLNHPPAPTVAVNDHTCRFCGNTSCSKTEKSCWKCGGVIP